MSSSRGVLVAYLGAHRSLNALARHLSEIEGIKSALSKISMYEIEEAESHNPALLLYLDVVNKTDDAYTFSVEIIEYVDETVVISRRASFDDIGEVLDGDEVRSAAATEGERQSILSSSINELANLSNHFKVFAGLTNI